MKRFFAFALAVGIALAGARPLFAQTQALYLSASAAANTSGTQTTISLGSLLPATSATLFDAQFCNLSVTNPTASAQAVTAVQLQFTDTVGGVASTGATYSATMPATLAAGSNGVYSIPITQGVLKNAQVIVTFAANPTASTVNVVGAFSAAQPPLVPYDAFETASAARTTAYVGSTHSNLTGHRGVLVYANVTAASGTGGLQVTVENLDPVSGQWAQANSSPTAVVTTGLIKIHCYDGGTSSNPGATQFSSGPLCKNWRIHVFVGDASSYTYSVGYTLLP